MEKNTKKEWEENKEKALVTFYSSLITENSKLDVYTYMVCYSYINGLNDKDKSSHFKALYSARENFENNIQKQKIKKIEK